MSNDQFQMLFIYDNEVIIISFHLCYYLISTFKIIT
jgi:hypothetical protein